MGFAREVEVNADKATSTNVPRLWDGTMTMLDPLPTWQVTSLLKDSRTKYKLGPEQEIEGGRRAWRLDYLDDFGGKVRSVPWIAPSAGYLVVRNEMRIKLPAGDTGPGDVLKDVPFDLMQERSVWVRGAAAGRLRVKVRRTGLGEGPPRVHSRDLKVATTLLRRVGSKPGIGASRKVETAGRRPETHTPDTAPARPA